MLLSLLYLVVRRVLSALAPSEWGDMERKVELLVLRHQVKVLSRRARGPVLRRRDRVLLAAASRILPRNRWMAFVVTPRTLLRWHRELVRRKSTFDVFQTSWRCSSCCVTRAALRGWPSVSTSGTTDCGKTCSSVRGPPPQKAHTRPSSLIAPALSQCGGLRAR